MKKIYLIIIMLCILMPSIVKAECTDGEKIALSKMVDNIKITPVFYEDTEKFSILISNVTSSIYFKDINTQIIYSNSEKEQAIYNVEPGQSYRIRFYSAIPACYGDVITTSYVTLPGYNRYYKDTLCKELEEYKICQKWVNYNYSREQFEKEVNKIEKKVEEKKVEEKKEETVKGFYDYLGELYEKYYYIFLTIIIVGGIITINYLRKKEDFF